MAASTWRPPTAKPEHDMFTMLRNLQSTEGSRSPSLEGDRPGFLKPLVPQRKGKFLASGIWARPGGLQGTDYAFWNSRKVRRRCGLGSTEDSENTAGGAGVYGAGARTTGHTERLESVVGGGIMQTEDTQDVLRG